MKKLITILFLFCGIKIFAQTANAGADQTIYLSSTSTATLDGSGSSGTSYLWSDITNNIGYPMLMNMGIEGHPTNTGTITSPTSKTTTVTGLSQGTWYYQIAVTTGGTTKYDTMIVFANYAPDVSGTYMRGLPLSEIRSTVNERYDTTSYITTETSTSEGDMYFDRSRLSAEYVDTVNGKFYSVVEDGYQWNNDGYARSEIHLGGSEWNNGAGLDSNVIYCFEWKGYFPQDFSNLTANSGGVVTIMQIHGDSGGDPNGPPFAYVILNGYYGTNHSIGSPGLVGLYAYERRNNKENFTFLDTATKLINHAHTLRLYIKEGLKYPGQDAFIKIDMDGVQKYYRDTGIVGQTIGTDYPKFASIYDSGNEIVDPSNHTRNRKFALVTENYRIYQNVDTSGTSNNPPTANAGSDQTITLPTNSVSLSGSGTDTDGTIASYAWTKISGGSATITSPSSANTTVTGLAQGTYTFRLTVTDNEGATGYDDMNVTVNPAASSPISNALILYGNYQFK